MSTANSLFRLPRWHSSRSMLSIIAALLAAESVLAYDRGGFHAFNNLQSPQKPYLPVNRIAAVSCVKQTEAQPGVLVLSE